MMQKNYRNFTVGELLDMGLKVSVSKHRVNREEAKNITRKFEGTKQSSHSLDFETEIITAKKKLFEASMFVDKEV